MFNAYQRVFLSVYYQHHLCLLSVEVRGQLAEICSLLPPSASPLLAEPSHQPWVLVISCLF